MTTIRTPTNTTRVTAEGTTSQAPGSSASDGTASSAASPVGPPTPGAPIVPAGFTPRTAQGTRTLRSPLKFQEAHALGVAAELTKLAAQSDWSGVQALGLTTPLAFRDRLLAAAGWSAEAANARAWEVYARSMRGDAWNKALAAGMRFKPLLLHAVDAGAPRSVGVTATLSFLNARAAVSQRAANTRNAATAARNHAVHTQALAEQAHQVAQQALAAQAVRQVQSQPNETPPETEADVPTDVAVGTPVKS